MAKKLTDAEKAERAKKLTKAALKKRRARADTKQSSDFDTVISDLYGTPEEKEQAQQQRTERLDKLKKEQEAPTSTENNYE